jgi:dipeptidase
MMVYLPNPHFFHSLHYDDFLGYYTPETNTISPYVPIYDHNQTREDYKAEKTEFWDEQNFSWHLKQRDIWREAHYQCYLEARDNWGYDREESAEYKAHNEEEEEPLPGEPRYCETTIEEEHEDVIKTRSQDEETTQDDDSDYQSSQDDDWNLEAALEHEDLPFYFFLCLLPLITDPF